ncbi:polysaccharide deacetylase family protein [Sphingobacterium sp. SGG-5]|uniref:polysaccharide deacetylase family protein n=1 Tax=Sphingobacterium sp. SGG-5 TaxID=2710881 RepID=UPI001F108C15|nr:polysaccharide deacetylase family protein [Sphingobacterium sp. SGG-5]
MYLKLFRPKGLLLFFSAIFFLYSCQYSSSSTLHIEKLDSTTTLSMDTIPVVAKNASGLSQRWDSLQRNLLVFPTDSLHPVAINIQKRILKDSLRQAFDTYPKHVFLTFDDGPLVGSAAIDSIARAKSVKISAFLVGRHAQMSKSRKKDIERYKTNPYVACYNHSFTHAGNKFNTFYNNPAAAFADFEKNETELELRQKVVRLPGRNIWVYDDVRRIDLQNSSGTADLLHTHGYRIFGWDVEWRIQRTTGVPVQPLNEVFNRIRNYMNNKSSMKPNNVVLLMHDDMFQTQKGKQLLVQLIDSLQKQNYTFEFMEDYPIRY